MKKKGIKNLQEVAFTLIELLVVIAIIGILSGLIVVSMNGSINSANDAKRKANIDTIRKALIVYGTLNGNVYPVQAKTCNIGGLGVLGCPSSFAIALQDYLTTLPVDPVFGYYTYYSLDGSDFTISAIMSNLKLYSYNASSSYYSSVVARSTYSPLYNKVNTIGGSGSNVDDSANGAISGYVFKFSAGWTGAVSLLNTKGFANGTYDFYARIRTDGTGNQPTSVYRGIYDPTALSYPISNGVLSGLTTSYQIKYLGRGTIISANSPYVYFSEGSNTTNYYLDYVEIKPVL